MKTDTVCIEIIQKIDKLMVLKSTIFCRQNEFFVFLSIFVYNFRFYELTINSILSYEYDLIFLVLKLVSLYFYGFKTKTNLLKKALRQKRFDPITVLSVVQFNDEVSLFGKRTDLSSDTIKNLKTGFNFSWSFV